MKHLSKLAATSITNRLLAMRFASEFLPIFALWTIMFIERGHMSLSQVGIILATGFILSIVFEIPTGVIADKIARKYVLVLSIISKVLALLVFLLFPHFWGYMAGTAFFSLGTALESGALQAYLYGTLDVANQKLFGKFWGRLTAMSMISYSLAYLVTAIIGVNYPVILLASITACLVATGIAFSLPKDKIVTKLGVKPKILASAMGHIARSKELTRLLAGSILIIAVAEVMIEYISLYYNQIGVPTRYVPLVFIPGNILSAILFWTLHSWEKTLNKNKVVIILLATLVFLATMNAPLAVAVGGFIIFSRMFRVLQIQFESNIQHLANSEARATITSIGAFISKTLTAIIVLIIGFTAHGSIVGPYRIALLAGVAVFVMIQIYFRYKDSQATQ